MSKSKICILGIDDGPFDKFKDSSADLIGAVYREGRIEGVLRARISVDGFDATPAILDMVKDSKWPLRAVLLDGIAVAGFNVINAEKIHSTTNLPVIIVSKSRPDRVSFISALAKLNMQEKIPLIDKLPAFFEQEGVFVQAYGIQEVDAKQLLLSSRLGSRFPEPIRAAHIIAKGIRDKAYAMPYDCHSHHPNID